LIDMCGRGVIDKANADAKGERVSDEKIACAGKKVALSW